MYRNEEPSCEGQRDGEAPEKVAEVETEEPVEEADVPVIDVAETATNVRTCTRCGKPTKGYSGPCGVRCSNVPASPELLRQTPGEGDTSLTLTPVREVRESEAIPETKSPEKLREKIETVNNLIEHDELLCLKCKERDQHIYGDDNSWYRLPNRPAMKAHMHNEHHITIF